jgi:hypothetical protein
MCPNHSFQVEKMPKKPPQKKNKKKKHTHTHTHTHSLSLSLSPRAPLILPRAFFLLQLETKTQDYKELKPIAPPHPSTLPAPKKMDTRIKEKTIICGERRSPKLNGAFREWGKK